LRELGHHGGQIGDRALLQLLTNLRIDPGNVEIVNDGAAIQAGTADVEDVMAPGLYLVTRHARRSLEFGDGKFLRRIDHIQQVVGHFVSFSGCRLRRADVHTSVDRHGVNANDFAVTTFASDLMRYG